MLWVILQWTRIPSGAVEVETLIVATYFGILGKRRSDRPPNTNTLRVPATALLKKVLDLLKFVLTFSKYSFYVRNVLINVLTIDSFDTIPTITDKRLGTNLHFCRFLPNEQPRPNTTSPAQPLPPPHLQ